MVPKTVQSTATLRDLMISLGLKNTKTYSWPPVWTTHTKGLYLNSPQTEMIHYFVQSGAAIKVK